MVRNTIPVLILATAIDTAAAFIAQYTAYLLTSSVSRFIFPLQILLTVVLAAWVLSAILAERMDALPRRQALVRRGLPLAAGMGAVTLLSSVLSNLVYPPMAVMFDRPSVPVQVLAALLAKAIFLMLTWLMLTALNRWLWQLPASPRRHPAAALIGVVLMWTAVTAPLVVCSFSVAISGGFSSMGILSLLYALQQVFSLPAIYAVGLIWAAALSRSR